MGFGSWVDRPRWQNFSPAHHMRWERRPDLGLIKRNRDKRGLMECQKLLSREAWEEVGIKGRSVSLRTAVLLSGCIAHEAKKRNFTQMRNFSLFFFNTFLTWAWGTQDKLGCRSHLCFFWSQAYFVYWFLSGCAKVFVLLIIIFVATGNWKGMQTVHWRKVN